MNFSRHFWTRVLYYSHVVRSHGRPDFPNFSNGPLAMVKTNEFQWMLAWTIFGPPVDMGRSSGDLWLVNVKYFPKMGVDCIWTTLIKVFDLLKIFIKQCQTERATPTLFTPTRFFTSLYPNRKVNDFKIDLYSHSTFKENVLECSRRMHPDVRGCKFYFLIHEKHISV